MSVERRIPTVLALCLLVTAGSAELHLKCLAQYRCGLYSPKVLLGDSDHDSLGEVITYDHSWAAAPVWQILEYRPVNRLTVVQSDTGEYPWPQEPLVDNFVPFDIGDIDRDGKTDLVGECWYRDSLGIHKALCTVEGRSPHGYPDTLNWWVPDGNSTMGFVPRAYAQLDGDTWGEILTPSYPPMNTAVWENVRDDCESLVCQTPHGAYCPTIWGDFDRNGRMDYVARWCDSVFVCECSGDNQYSAVCSLYVGKPNLVDMFTGNDVDSSGRPEFFAVFAQYMGYLWRLYLYEFGAPREHDYTYYLVDSVMAEQPDGGRSLCADVDGDGLDEVVWGDGRRVHVLKASGTHQFREVGTWTGDTGEYTVLNAADFNRNGYPEVYKGGDTLLSVLEIDAVHVVYPDTSQLLAAGDTCDIRWRIYTPPRCDSVSLFLRCDSNTVNGFYRLDTIAHGLSPSDSTYSWVVPDTTLDSARILAIAYGPGWQFDESDSPFRIAPAGVAGPRITPPHDWALSVSPNPARGAFHVSYDVPRKAVVQVGLYDVAGRLAEEYASGELEPGRYQAAVREGLAPGVYFLQLGTAGRHMATKLAVLR